MSPVPIPPRPRAGGFMLIEMLAAVILLTAFALVATHLFTWSMRVLREAPQAQQDMARLDVMLDRLRADVWSAHRIEVPDATTVRLHAAGRAPVVWRVEAQTVTRVDGGADADDVTNASRGPAQSWRDLRAVPEFEHHEPAALVVRLTDARGRAQGELWMTSQVLSR